MKRIKYYFLLLVVSAVGFSCNKEVPNYPKGYDHEYYVFYDYVYDVNNSPKLVNQTIKAEKSSEELIPLNIKFMSSFYRDYDVDVRLYIRQTPYFLTSIGVTKPPKNEYSTLDSLAVPGVDFQLVNPDGKILTPIRNDSLTYYTIKFPNAKKDVKTVYVKMLNNTDVDHVRSVWFSFTLHRILIDTEANYRFTNLNLDQGEYKVRTAVNSSFRRIDIR